MTGIAIVGQGYMGRTHAQAWSSLGLGEEIKYVCGRSKGAPLEHAPAARFVTELDIVLNDPDVDVVSVCTPTPTHRAIAEAALAAGKSVLLEKPIALTVDDGVALDELASHSEGILMIAQVVRFFGGYRELREHVASGVIGSVVSARARRFIQQPDWAEWWHDDAQSGGMLVDFAIHDFDQMNMFLGDPVMVNCAAVSRLGPIETTIRYRGGAIGQVLSYADLDAGAPFTSSLGLVGTAGFADYEFSAGAPTGTAGGDDDAGDVSRLRVAGVGGRRVTDIRDDAPYTRQVEYFLQCVVGGVQPNLATTASAIRALEVSLAARHSLESGTPVEVVSVVRDASAAGSTGLPVRSGDEKE